MSLQDAFERIVASLNEAMLDGARWPETSGLIDEACRAKGNILVFGDESSSGTVEIFFASLCYRGVRHHEWEREYFDVYHRVDERVPRLRRLPGAKVVSIPELYTESERRTSPAYNEGLARGHYQNGLNVRLDGPEGSRIVWAMADPVNSRGWSSEQIDLVERLLPHLRQYVRIRAALADAGALVTTVNGFCENMRVGVIHLDRRGRIVEANDCARGLLRQGEGLFDTDGMLRAEAPGDDARLQALLARALPCFGGQGESGSMLVKRPHEIPKLVLHVTPVADRASAFRTAHLAALVLVNDPANRTRPDPGTLETAFGFTQTESEIAVLFAEGKTIRQIAMVTGRGVGTTRWHMKRILNKAGVSRQVDLVRLVLGLAATPVRRG